MDLRAARGGVLLELLEVSVEVVEDVVLDRRAGMPQLLPVGRLRDQAGAPLPDRPRGLADVAAQLRVLDRALRVGRKIRSRPPVLAPDDFAAVHAAARSVLARISARWSVRTPARSRSR